jgi:prephenate dehydrogenase
MNIVIIGLGNIGGSFAQGIQQCGDEHNVYAIDVDEEALRLAEKQQLIKKGYTDPKDIIPEADFIIFAVYPRVIVDIIDQYYALFRKNSIITDVTGVKRQIIAEIEDKLPPEVDFVFGHPMAGRENRGLKYASSEVFKGANYLVTPTERNKKENIEFLKNFVKKIGFRNISEISPDFHDDVIGFTSQLAHVIAVSLINSDDVSRNTKKYTGDSYRDLTRITNINEKLWPELFIMNKDYLQKHINEFTIQLEKLSMAIRDEDIATMQEMMRESRKRYHDLHDLDMPD